jgi:hypothetical protein
VVILPSLDEAIARSRQREERVLEEHTRAQHGTCAAWDEKIRRDTTGLSIPDSLALVLERLS